MRIKHTRSTLLSWLQKQMFLLRYLERRGGYLPSSVSDEIFSVPKSKIYRELCANNAKIRHLLEEELFRSGAYNAFELGLFVQNTDWPGEISDVGIDSDRIAKAILTEEDKRLLENEYSQYVSTHP